MCFSLQASIITAGTLGTISLFYVGKEYKRSTLLMAFIPFLFSIQQASEALIWRFFAVKKSMITVYATYAFLCFAYIVWPVWVPFSLWFIEHHSLRKKLLLVTLAIGAVTSAILGYIIYANPVKITVDCAHIIYHTAIPSHMTMPLLISYSIATITPWFISIGYRMWLVGILMLLGYGVSLWYYLAAFTSVWCFFAAAISATLFIILDALHKKIPANA